MHVYEFACCGCSSHSAQQQQQAAHSLCRKALHCTAVEQLHMAPEDGQGSHAYIYYSSLIAARSPCVPPTHTRTHTHTQSIISPTRPIAVVQQSRCKCTLATQAPFACPRGCSMPSADLLQASQDSAVSQEAPAAHVHKYITRRSTACCACTAPPSRSIRRADSSLGLVRLPTHTHAAFTDTPTLASTAVLNSPGGFNARAELATATAAKYEILLRYYATQSAVPTAAMQRQGHTMLATQ